MDLRDKEIVLGVSGGIACYKSLEIVRGIREAGGRVSVIMTKSAMEFINPLPFQTLSERSVATSLFSLSEESQIGHIKIGENIDAFVIAPATANIIGKAANGIADDYLSTVLLACDAPLILAPAMNYKMWEHQAVQANLSLLKARGATIVPPGSGYLACGTYGTGRMASVDLILRTVDERIRDSAGTKIENRLDGIKVLITAGPTIERIDAVRYLTNYSSGKMGYAIATVCAKEGADVCLISGPTHLAPPENVNLVKVNSADEMYHAVMKHADDASLIIKAAAVSDYKAKNRNPQKTKKQESLQLELVKTKDILEELGRRKTDMQFLIGFAAESENVEEYAATKLKRKNLDLIVANNILAEDAGFNVDTNRVLLIDAEGANQLPLLSKEEVAEELLNYLETQPKWKKIRNS